MGYFLINDLPEEERPRERMHHYGEDSLSNAELLAIINSTGSRGLSAIDLSQQILTHFDGSLLSTPSLTFHKNEREVNTASSVQVRQPIYNTSVNLWKNYDKELDSLSKILTNK